MADQTTTDNLLFFDPDFDDYASEFRKEHGANGITRAVSNTTDLIEAVKEYSLVRNVELVLHGSPGSIWFKSGGLMAASYFGTITNAAKMLAANARVLFLGCSIADGDAGDKFLTDVGRNMFSGLGGIVGGTTVTNAVLKGGITRMNPLRFFDAALKVRRFDANGKLVSGQNVSYWGTQTNIDVK